MYIYNKSKFILQGEFWHIKILESLFKVNPTHNYLFSSYEEIGNSMSTLAEPLLQIVTALL